MLPAQWLALVLRHDLARRIPVFYHRVCLRIIGLTLTTRGEIAASRPVLFIANHSSYLDIAVLGSILPLSFVAKREVAGWPFFGLLAKLQRTVFVDRRHRRMAGEQRDQMVARLKAGDNLVLFPEGTSDDGNRVFPFKSALLGAAETEIEGRPVTVQPVSIAYTRLNGVPLGRALRPLLAWYGDMDLLPHFLRVFSLGRVSIEVTFHAPVRRTDFVSRRELSDHCHRMVATGVAASIAGRDMEALGGSPEPPPAQEIADPASRTAPQTAGQP